MKNESVKEEYIEVTKVKMDVLKIVKVILKVAFIFPTINRTGSAGSFLLLIAVLVPLCSSPTQLDVGRIPINVTEKPAPHPGIWFESALVSNVICTSDHVTQSTSEIKVLLRIIAFRNLL